jgi:predicted dehydrogenase
MATGGHVGDAVNHKNLRVGIVGCGQIAEAHLGEIRFLEGATVAAVCDVEPLLAQDMADRHQIPAWYDDYGRMLESARLDVVHLTTPPQTHLALGREAVSHGIHVYVEKPFCVSTVEAVQLIAEAQRHDRLVCAGFSERGDVAARRLSACVAGGELGEIVHIESYYGDNPGGNFAKVFRATPGHWVNRLPGKVIQNVVPHAVYHVVPLMPPEPDHIEAIRMDRSGNGVYDDELRVMWQSGSQTAYITFTSGVRPVRQFMRVYGSLAIAEVDFTNHLFSIIDDTKLPGPVARVRNAIIPGFRLVRQGLTGIRHTLSGRDRFFAGMGRLFAEFYEAIRAGRKMPPVPYAEVLRVCEVIDRIVGAFDASSAPGERRSA